MQSLEDEEQDSGGEQESEGEQEDTETDPDDATNEFLEFFQFFGDVERPTPEELQSILELRPENFAQNLDSMAEVLSDRYEEGQDLEDLEAAIQMRQTAVALADRDDALLPLFLANLSYSLTDRYERLDTLADLDGAIKNLKDALDLTPKEHVNHPKRLRSLGLALSRRYRRRDTVEDMDLAVESHREAIQLVQAGDPDRPAYVQALASALTDRFQRRERLEDLEEALQTDQLALELTPEGDPERAGRFRSVAGAFRDRYKRLGYLKDLEAALHHEQAAVKLFPHNSLAVAGYFFSLGVILADRYRRLGDFTDMQASLKSHETAVEKTAHGHPELPPRLVELGSSYIEQFEVLGDPKDLDIALNHCLSAVALTPRDHPDFAGYLWSLAASYTARYKVSDELEDLQAAVNNDLEAVSLTPVGDLNLPTRLTNLAISLADRYRRLGDSADLEAAIQHTTNAVGLVSEDNPNFASNYHDLADFLIMRYESANEVHDLDLAFSALSKAFKAPSLNPIGSWDAAIRWASYGKLYRRSECIKAYAVAFELLSEILWMGNSLTVQQASTRRIDITSATSDAIGACIDGSNYELATEFLELGLATAFQQQLQLRTQVDDLPEAIAEEFNRLSSLIYSGTSGNPTDLVLRRNELITKIRTLPGLERFLQPTLFQDLHQVSKHGPVVILNSHEDHCDAIILLHSSVVPLHVPLPGVTVEALADQKLHLSHVLHTCSVRTRTSDSTRLFGSQELFSSKPVKDIFEDMLTWLWTEVVNPVFNALEVNSVLGGRLWWCPSGAFTGLPLHSAAPSDQFIHSYTSTLGALLKARSKGTSSGVPKVGVVGVTHNSEARLPGLPGVTTEISKIKSIVGDDRVECLVGAQATVDAVKHQLSHCAWLHLACHGKQDLFDPPKSCLQLYDGTLDLETIIRTQLDNAELVFLAACQTAMGDAELVNESFHLAGGFIAAGFRGAIGTMWSMRDSDGPLVTEVVYGHLFRGGRRPEAGEAAKALQLAVRKMRNAGIAHERWMPFIHMGM
ncbi:CHAT domain-containing protein [Mycena latifolia]|nr:CHAT domain-containing protein [Mycena latifolia]